MPQEYAKGIFQEYAKGGKTTHIPLIAKLTPMPKYTNMQKKVPTTKTTQNVLKYKAKTLYY